MLLNIKLQPHKGRNFQVCQSPNHEYGQMGNFKVYATFNRSLGQTAPSAHHKICVPDS